MCNECLSHKRQQALAVLLLSLQTCSANTFGCKWWLLGFATPFLLPKPWAWLASHSFIDCAMKDSRSWFLWPKFPRKDRRKATLVNGWRSESLLGRWWIYHPAVVGRLVLLKAWNFRGRYLRTWAPLMGDEWSLRFAVAFPSTHCLRVYPSYLSGFAKNRKIIPEDSEE